MMTRGASRRDPQLKHWVTYAEGWARSLSVPMVRWMLGSQLTVQAREPHAGHQEQGIVSFRQRFVVVLRLQPDDNVRRP